jgi:hypothetical protein
MELKHVPSCIIADASAAAGAGRRIERRSQAGGISSRIIPAPSLAAVTAAVTITIVSAALTAVAAPVTAVAAVTAVTAVTAISAASIVAAPVTRIRRRNGEQGTKFAGDS